MYPNSNEAMTGMSVDPAMYQKSHESTMTNDVNQPAFPSGKFLNRAQRRAREKFVRKHAKLLAQPANNELPPDDE